MKKGTALLREKNKREVLRILRKNKGCSRKDIVDLSKVTKNTISLIIEDLIQNNIVSEDGVQLTKSVGRPQVSLSIIPGSIKLIAISLEEDKLTVVLMDYELNELQKIEAKYKNHEECFDKLKSLIGELAGQHDIFGVGVVLPGIVDSENGIVKLSLRLNFKDLDLKSMIAEVFTGRILIMNSVKALALLYMDREIEGTDSLFYIRIGRGIGGALIHKNALLNGNNWTAGEIGQLEVENSDTNRCTLEELVNSITSKWHLGNENEKNRSIKQLAVGLSQAVSAAIYLYDPEKILFDCPFNSNECFKDELIKQLKDNQFVSKFYKENLLFEEEGMKIVNGAAFSLIHEYEKMAEE